MLRRAILLGMESVRSRFALGPNGRLPLACGRIRITEIEGRGLADVFVHRFHNSEARVGAKGLEHH